MIFGGSMKFVHLGVVAVVALATTAFANEPTKTRQVTFLPLGKTVNASVVESPGGVRAYTFLTKVDAKFAILLVKEREQGATVYTEASKNGAITVLAIPKK